MSKKRVNVSDLLKSMDIQAENRASLERRAREVAEEQMMEQMMERLWNRTAFNKYTKQKRANQRVQRDQNSSEARRVQNATNLVDYEWQQRTGRPLPKTATPRPDDKDKPGKKRKRRMGGFGKIKERKIKGRMRKIHSGPRGGAYYITKGRKVYVS